MTTDAPDRAAPLAGVRVLNLGTRWPGRVAAMLLADQGADVVEIVRPGRESHAVDPLLDRGKRLVELDLKNEAAQRLCRDRAAEVDVAIENMRPGAAAALGLDYAALGGERSGLVHISLPGFAEGDPMRDVPAWEGTVCAAVGVYTDISPLGALLGRPVYTAIPMASAYGGVLGSLAASLGLYRRQRTGRGQHIEVPLADCVMAAMALLTCKIEGQPARYNFPPIDNAVLDLVFPALRDLRGGMTEDHVAGIADYVRGHANPTINFYECADGRILFVCAPDHVYQNRAFLQAIGVYDRVIAEGMVSETPYTEHDAGNNVNKAASLTPAWRKRLIGLIAQAVKARPAAEWEATMRAANVPASMVRTSAEWLADPAVLEAGITADLDDPVRGPVRQPGRFLSIENAAVRSPGLRAGTPAAEDFAWLAPPMERPDPAGRGPDADADLPSRGMLEGVRVLDFSNIVAGPAAGRTLAEHGADVTRIDPPAPQAGPYATMWFGVDVNQGKRAAVLDLKSDAGKVALARLVAGADVVLHNFLDRSARSLGIAHDQLAAINPAIVSAQIGGWTGMAPGPWDDDPSFDPVLQAATGIMARYGDGPDKPVMHAIASCVDYITGFSTAAGIAQALLARQRGQGGSYVRTSLAMAAQLVQFPHMVAWDGAGPGAEPSGQQATGEGPGQRLYETADGWAWIGCRPGDAARLALALGGAVGASDGSANAIADAVRRLPTAEIHARLAALPGAGAAALRTLADIRADRTVDAAEAADGRSNWMSSGSITLRRGPHPSGHPTTLPLPTWVRPEAAAVRHLDPAPLPGAHTAEVLAGAGHSDEEIDGLMASGAARDGWAVLPRYLPT
ncbi:MAG: hypothetical protein F4160_03700 [Rhodospirillaceae bacterium]|nr:hypothetical protein [Rhodospirillaceae bacterium]MYH35885.1 hypothetical protein [Rhodospirillaceae bacterium]MYK14028.1 hypothetical protein [Rhodospirillaceae bacterium]